MRDNKSLLTTFENLFSPPRCSFFFPSPLFEKLLLLSALRSRCNDDRRKQMAERFGPTRYRFAQSVVPNRASGQEGLSTIHTEAVTLDCVCLSHPFYSHSARIISNYITAAITSHRRLRSALVTTRSSHV